MASPAGVLQGTERPSVSLIATASTITLDGRRAIPAVSIITTCRARLHHLRQTLPSMAGQGARQVIVVDYDCPDGTGSWVEASHPQVKVVRGYDPLGFCTARARNLGAAEAEGEWLAFIDADNIIAPGWLAWLSERLVAGRFYVMEADPSKRDSAGAILCRRSDFNLAGRYDEAIRGWGGEDVDLSVRLRAIGLAKSAFPSTFLQPVSHDDGQRILRGGLSKSTGSIRGKLYIRAKLELARRMVGLEQCCREALLETAANAVRGSASLSVKQHYPFRFHLYCPACAARFGANVRLELDYQPRTLLRRECYRLTSLGAL